MSISKRKMKKINITSAGGRHCFSVCSGDISENRNTITCFNSAKMRSLCKEKCDTALVALAEHAGESKIIRKTVKMAAEWIDIDDKDYRIEGEYKKIPLGIICSIVAIAISMLMIVAGNIMVSQASMELWALEEEYETCKEYEAELKSKLAIKNDLRYIEHIARTELGMVDREHAEVIYVGNEPQNKVVAYDKVSNNDKMGLSTLLYSLGVIE